MDTETPAFQEYWRRFRLCTVSFSSAIRHNGLLCPRTRLPTWKPTGYWWSKGRATVFLRASKSPAGEAPRLPCSSSMEPVDSPSHLMMIGDDLASWRRTPTEQRNGDTLITEWTDCEVLQRDLPWFIWGSGDRTMTGEQMNLVSRVSLEDGVHTCLSIYTGCSVSTAAARGKSWIYDMLGIRLHPVKYLPIDERIL